MGDLPAYEFSPEGPSLWFSPSATCPILRVDLPSQCRFSGGTPGIRLDAERWEFFYPIASVSAAWGCWQHCLCLPSTHTTQALPLSSIHTHHTSAASVFYPHTTCASGLIDCQLAGSQSLIIKPPPACPCRVPAAGHRHGPHSSPRPLPYVCSLTLCCPFLSSSDPPAPISSSSGSPPLPTHPPLTRLPSPAGILPWATPWGISPAPISSGSSRICSSNGRRGSSSA